MDPKLFATVFGTNFIAELGDKVQLATLLYATEPSRPAYARAIDAGAQATLGYRDRVTCVENGEPTSAMEFANAQTYRSWINSAPIGVARSTCSIASGTSGDQPTFTTRTDSGRVAANSKAGTSSWWMPAGSSPTR